MSLKKGKEIANIIVFTRCSRNAQNQIEEEKENDVKEGDPKWSELFVNTLASHGMPLCLFSPKSKNVK